MKQVQAQHLQTEKLTNSEGYFQSLFEAIPEGIIVTDASGKILNFNPAAEHILKLKRSEIEGVLCASLNLETINTDGDPLTFEEAIFSRAIINKSPVMDSIVGIRRSNETISWICSNAVPLFNSNDEVQSIVTTLTDITERKQAEEKLQKSCKKERKLRQEMEVEIENRLKFTKELAHELKTPLTSALASSDLLVSELNEGPLLSLARNINQSTCNLNNRINELLDLTKAEMGMLDLEYEQIDPLQLLQDIVDEMAPVALKHKQSLTLDVSTPLQQIVIDEARLKQVVLNLLTNAIKFTPEEGTISLKAGQDGTSWIVEVHHTGHGITIEKQQRLLKPYRKIESDGDRIKILGLGLAQSKTLVELHGGQIWAENHTDKGSTIGFAIPFLRTPE